MHYRLLATFSCAVPLPLLNSVIPVCLFFNYMKLIALMCVRLSFDSCHGWIVYWRLWIKFVALHHAPNRDRRSICIYIQLIHLNDALVRHCLIGDIGAYPWMTVWTCLLDATERDILVNINCIDLLVIAIIIRYDLMLVWQKALNVSSMCVRFCFSRDFSSCAHTLLQ